MPSLNPKEPGLISRRFGSRRDGMREVIEVWDVTELGCSIIASKTELKTVTRKFWISNFAAADMQEVA
jgi:hypothetical protein